MPAKFYREPQVVIVSAKRTAFGKLLGLHREKKALDLAYQAAQACIDPVQYAQKNIDHVIVGSVLSSGGNHAYLPRHLSLDLGLNLTCPSYLVNRLCGSGMQAIIEAYQLIKLRKAHCVLALGVESMSHAPSYVFGQRKGFKFGDQMLEDSIVAVLHDRKIDMIMGQTADHLAKIYNIERAAADEYAHKSQEKYQEAYQAGFYAQEIDSNNEDEQKDEYHRMESLEVLHKLPSIFEKDGVSTVASSSGLADGASAVLLMDQYEADLHGIEYVCSVKDYALEACDPKLMGLGPVHAIRKLLNQQALSMRDIALFDINEAFAAQMLAVKHELGIPKQRLNIHGGSLAMGHPLGASANRNVVTLNYALQNKSKNYGIASACMGGGQGAALLLQNLKL